MVSDDVLRNTDVSVVGAHILVHVDIFESSFADRLNVLTDGSDERKCLNLNNARSTSEDETRLYSFIFVCPKTIDLSMGNFLNKLIVRCNAPRAIWLQKLADEFIRVRFVVLRN